MLAAAVDVASIVAVLLVADGAESLVANHL